MVVLYDGVCGLCDRLVQFSLKRDKRGRVRYAALQGPWARATLGRHGKDPEDLDTVYVVVDPEGPGERLVRKGRAILALLGALGLPWSLVAIFSILPTFLLDFFYDRVARNRYRLFGKYDTCQRPDPAHQARFIGDES
jgi:predicted DCC family thiol-disulfide oxidoreductase YuxK